MPSSSTLMVSRSRAKPASRNIKPACMKNTRNAVTNTHMVLIGLQYGGSGTAGAAAAGAFVPETAFVLVNALVSAVAAFVTALVSCACALELAPRYIEI